MSKAKKKCKKCQKVKPINDYYYSNTKDRYDVCKVCYDKRREELGSDYVDEESRYVEKWNGDSAIYC